MKYLHEVEGLGSIRARLVTYSTSAAGIPISTWELRYPRFIHAQVMTHRVFSRNAASSRAIPLRNRVRQVWSDPATPLKWGGNKSGMVAGHATRWAGLQRLWWRGIGRLVATTVWYSPLRFLHKQHAARLLEPWLFMDVILTTTDLNNFFDLRLEDDAQPEIQELAACMKEVLVDVEPARLEPGQAHLPYVLPEERERLTPQEAVKVSVARCARVSFEKQGRESLYAEDGIRHDSLLQDRHMSPFEHQAFAVDDRNIWSGNFRGWIQYRKYLVGSPAEIHIPCLKTFNPFGV